MHTSAFFRFFPPPTFLAMKHVGLDISDDALYCIQYGKASASSGWRDTLGLYASVEVPEGLIQGGDIKDEKKLIDLLIEMRKKYGLSYVKVSVPEEKAYLFQTNVPGGTVNEIRQNIEFKLEENVPLSAADAVFYYDLLPLSVTGGTLRASVSVVPRSYIERYISILSAAGVFPVAFEIVPKAIARAIVPIHSDKTLLVLHSMNHKTGIYVVSGGVVSFTSTAAWGKATPIEEGRPSYVEMLAREVERVYSYWSSREGVTSDISAVVLVGHNAAEYEPLLEGLMHNISVPVEVANAWQNTLDVERYVPPISKEDSLQYVVAAGLAMDS